MIDIHKPSLLEETRVERRLGYDNKMMYEYCLLLHKVISQTKVITSGRGKKKESRTILKDNISKDVLDKINNSVEYYKKNMSSTLKFRDYQTEIIAKGKQILTSKKFLYLSMEVRTGKTLTSLAFICTMTVAIIAKLL